MHGSKDYHPLVLLNYDSLNAQFPLILIIGREPNNDVVMKDCVEEDDIFSITRQCAFWNASYKFVAQVNEVSYKNFLELCERKRSAPIAFAEASPIPIKYGMSKASVISAIPREQLEDHASRIFSKSIINRVEVVVLTGVNDKRYELPFHLIEEECKARNKPFMSVPFQMTFTNWKGIARCINDQENADTLQAVRTVYDLWEQDSK